MLVFSNERYYSKDDSIITLPVEGGFIYIPRYLYDRCLTLGVKHSQQSILTLLGGELTEIVEWATKVLPTPVSYLAPYLTTISVEIPMEIDKVVGCLHGITNVIDPYDFIQKPAEIRKILTFGPSIFEEYQRPWHAFFMTCVKEDFITHAIPYAIGPAEWMSLASLFAGNGGFSMPSNTEPQKEMSDGTKAILDDIKNGNIVATDVDPDVDPELLANYLASDFDWGGVLDFVDDASANEDDKKTETEDTVVETGDSNQETANSRFAFLKK